MLRMHALLVGATALALSACGPKDTQAGTTPARRAKADGPRRAAPPARATAASPYHCPAAGSPLMTPTRWDEGKGQLRRFLSETHLDRVVTTKATPVEVCGSRGQLAWLVRARCPDGSAPFKDERAAHSARVGNVGAGGRCNRIVDLFKVPCPSKTFQIHVDYYNCEQGEEFPSRAPRGGPPPVRARR